MVLAGGGFDDDADRFPLDLTFDGVCVSPFFHGLGDGTAHSKPSDSREGVGEGSSPMTQRDTEYFCQVKITAAVDSLALANSIKLAGY